MEALAYRVLQLGDGWSLIITYALVVISACAGAYLIKSELKISRAVFFLSFGFALLLNGASMLLALGVQEAIKGGYLAIIVVLLYGSTIPVGIFLGAMAAARARDAYGSSNKWFYALIPLVNLILFFVPSQTPAPRTPWRLIRNIALIVMGFILAGTGKGLETAASRESTRLANRAEMDQVLVQKSLEYEVQNNGIEGLLNQMASATAVPSKIDEITTIKAVEVEGNTLRYVYELSRDDLQFNQAWHEKLTNSWCRMSDFRTILSFDAAIEGIYVDRSGKQIGTVKVSSRICSEWETKLRLTMEEAAQSIKGPQKLDEVTTIEGASYADRIMTYNYTLTQDINDQEHFHNVIRKKLCTSDNFKGMYELDIVVKFVYRNPDGNIAAEVTGDKTSCANDS